jgi:hypothetical protein
LVKTKQHNVLAVGQNGAEAYDYANGKHKKTIEGILKRHGDALLGVFISGGGNDFAGFHDLRPLLKNNCSGETTAEGCFNKPPSASLEALLDQVYDSYITLIGRVLASCKQPDLKIFLHNYDYPYPTGEGAFGKGTWLQAALLDAKVPEHLQRSCLKFVIDEFTKRLEKIAQLNPNTVVLVDSRETVTREEWSNELHPTEEGFRKIAHEKWHPLLRTHNLAS